MRTIEKIIAENIIRLRDARGISQLQLAKDANLSQTTMNRVEKAKQRLSPTSMRSVAKVLMVDETELYMDRAILLSPLTKQEQELLTAFRNGSDEMRANIVIMVQGATSIEKANNLSTTKTGLGDRDSG